MILNEYLALSLLLACAKCQGLDLTIQEGTNGSAVVSACLSRLRDSEIFPSDNEMLRRIAYVETGDGNNPDTYRVDYHGGIWALDETLFEETQDIASHESALTALHQEIQAKFSINWAEVEWYDLRKPLYSALAARLYLSTLSTLIPISSLIQSQATYWINYYNPSASAWTFVTLVNDLLATEGCSVSGIDIYFVMDESGSIGAYNYELMKQFVNDTVNEFDIGPSDTQVGVISYASSARYQFYLNTYHDKPSIQMALWNLVFSSGGTNTAEAIDILWQSGFTLANGGRPEPQAIPRIGVVITDGGSNNYDATITAAQNAHSEGITLFAVGIGNVNYNELLGIASESQYVSIINDFDLSHFEALHTTITNEACTTSAEVDFNETISTSIGKDKITHIKIPYDPYEGVTIKVNVTNGTVRVYASGQTRTPNEAFNDWMIETDSYSDYYFNPNDFYRAISENVFITIQGEEVRNNFTFVPEQGDTTVAPDALLDVAIGAVTATTVEVFWTPPANYDSNGIIIYYVEVTEYQFGLPPVTATTTDSSVVVIGLEEHNAYSCRVAAVTSSKVGAFSSPTNFTTSEAAPDGAPEQVSGTATNSTVITVTWQPPTLIHQNGYIVEYAVKVVETATGMLYEWNSTNTFLTVSMLHPYYVYDISVAAVTIGIGPFSDDIKVITDEAVPTGAPQNITAIVKSPYVTHLLWSPPLLSEQNGIIINYVIYITEKSSGCPFEKSTSNTSLSIDENLHPYHTYICEIAAETSVGLGPFSVAIFFTTHEDVPSKPNISSASRIYEEPQKLLVVWSAPETPNGIIVNYSVSCNNSDSVETTTVCGCQLAAVVMNLTPFTDYDCSVSATTSAGEGDPSSVKSAQTEESEPGSAPTNFISKLINSTAIKLIWDEPRLPNGVIVSYTITYNTSEGVATRVQSVGIGGLEENTWYRFDIVASTRIGSGPSASLTTRTDISVPRSSPSYISVEVGGSRKVMLSWEPPPFQDQNGPITYYSLIVKELIFGFGDSHINATTLSYTLTDIEEHNNYSFIIAAATEKGLGPYSRVYNFTTEEDYPTFPPSNLSGHTTFSSILELSWAPPPVLDQNGVITRYVVKVCALETDTAWTMFALEESIQIGSLNLSYSYNFTVAASTSVGIGPFSQGITLKIDNSSSCEALSTARVSGGYIAAVTLL